MTLNEDRPAPDWLGDVSAGVDAWTRRRPAWSSSERQRACRDPGGRGRDGAAAVSTSSTSGAPPPEDTATQVPEADAESVARKILLDQLTGQARSRKELSDKLAKKLVPDDVATRLLDRFEEVGLVDDEAFARSWVAVPAAGQGPGPAGAGPGAAPQGHRRRGRPRGARRDRPGRRGGGRPGAGPQEAALAEPGRRHHRDPAAGRDAGPQGLRLRVWRSRSSATSWPLRVAKHWTTDPVRPAQNALVTTSARS